MKQSNSSSKQASILNTLSSSRAPVNNEATLSSSKKSSSEILKQRVYTKWEAIRVKLLSEVRNEKSKKYNIEIDLEFSVQQQKEAKKKIVDLNNLLNFISGSRSSPAAIWARVIGSPVEVCWERERGWKTISNFYEIAEHFIDDWAALRMSNFTKEFHNGDSGAVTLTSKSDPWKSRTVRVSSAWEICNVLADESASN